MSQLERVDTLLQNTTFIRTIVVRAFRFLAQSMQCTKGKLYFSWAFENDSVRGASKKPRRRPCEFVRTSMAPCASKFATHVVRETWNDSSKQCVSSSKRRSSGRDRDSQQSTARGSVLPFAPCKGLRRCSRKRLREGRLQLWKKKRSR